ncbi:MAG TPA: M23 family metallopeptidase [Thermoanaerobaculia bacterium]|jgi:murein DD-endopeptidase MepM/ murein hydrolase activator NlpD
MRFALCGALLLLSSTALALDVRVYPAGSIYVQRSNPDHGCVDLTVHNILIINEATRDVVLEGAVVEILKGARIIESRNIAASEIAATTSAISTNGQAATAELDIDFPWAALAAQHVTLARDSRLHGHQAAAVKNVFINVQEMPTAVRIRVRARGISASTTVGVSQKRPAAYHSPLRGVWLLRSIPNVTSHHRWNSQTEFAVDFFKLGENGLPWKTDGRSAADYFAFGAPVLAAADGVVVATENGVVQNYDVRLRREGESDADYDRRLTAYNAAMQKADPYKASLGNHVVIRHADNEYSMYHHLKTGSVSVRKGDRVSAGQPIGAVGDTGDTNLVHLHFQVSDGPDPLTARSIPFVFDDLFPPGGDYGKVVRTK